MSAWDTYGMKAETILANSWIQTSKKGYGNRFDELLFVVLGGVMYIVVFCWRSRIFVKKMFFPSFFHEVGRHEAPRAHIFS